jgi:hypothetical protein
MLKTSKLIILTPKMSQKGSESRSIVLVLPGSIAFAVLGLLYDRI